MNGKRIAALAIISALALSVGAAQAANPTATVTVKWNTQQLSTLTVVSNYSAAGAQQLTAPAIYQNVNGGSGACTAAGAGSEVAQTVNFGSVTPDAVKYTDCLYDNALLAQYATNDTNGYQLTVQETTAAAHDLNKLICYLPNGSQASAAVVQSARNSNASVPSIITVAQADASCGGGGAVAFKNATTSQITSGAGATAGTLNAGGDVELVLQPNAPSGADQGVVTYTLVLL